ncbi:MAG TPA: hypothetical protein VFL69_08490 [Marmoricola sp.]|nr:hypothetical protein [Marmoricola sp.]
MLSIRSRAIASASAGVVAAGTLTAVALTAAPADAAALTVNHARIGPHHHVHMTDVLRPGVHEIVVRSARQASFQIVRTHRGYSDRELAHDVNAGINGSDVKALERFERNVTLLGGVSSAPRHPGKMYVDLTRGGRYLAVDTNVRRTRAAQLHHFRVRGARVAGRLPSGKRITAIDEATWAARPKAIPTRGVLRFVNRSKDNHFIAMARLLPGKTEADFKAWVDAVMQGQDAAPPVEMSGPELDSGVVSPGHRMAFRYHLPKGHYILTCWWPDSEMGGMPHTFMGMYRQLNVR